MKSLRWQLVVGIVSCSSLLLAAGGTAAYAALRQSLYSDFDRSLVQEAVLLASLIEEEAGRIRIEWLDPGNSPEAHHAGIDYFSFWRKGTAEPLAASAGIENGMLPRFGGPFARPELREVTLPGGDRARCAGVEFDLRHGLRSDEEEEEDDDDDRAPVVASDNTMPASASSVVQLVIARIDTVAPTLGAVRGALFGLCGGSSLCGVAIIWVVVRRSLHPLEQLKSQIRGLHGEASGQRIALPRQPTELEPVTKELNRLLDRVDAALLRERTLTSNVAHELRTPIAGLLSTLEVTLNRMRSPAEYRESAGECLEIAKRLNWLVTNLLSITRIEAGNIQLQRVRVALRDVLTEWWRPFEERAAHQRLRVEWQIQPTVGVTTDPEFLRVVVTNLFDNAVSHAPRGATIRIAAADGTISFVNPAPASDVRTFEPSPDPFWRTPESLDGGGSHAGLGLKLCRKIIELLGGQITAEIQQPERQFVVRLELA